MIGGPPWNNQQWVGFGYDRRPLPATTASHRWFERPGLCDLNGGLPMHPAIIYDKELMVMGFLYGHSYGVMKCEWMVYVSCCKSLKAYPCHMFMGKL